jgi:hypothetical protein
MSAGRHSIPPSRAIDQLAWGPGRSSAGDARLSELKTYFAYVTDDRYQAPTLLAWQSQYDSAVMVMARAYLAASPHHQKIEVYDDDRFVGRVERPRPSGSDPAGRL